MISRFQYFFHGLRVATIYIMLSLWHLTIFNLRVWLSLRGARRLILVSNPSSLRVWAALNKLICVIGSTSIVGMGRDLLFKNAWII